MELWNNLGLLAGTLKIWPIDLNLKLPSLGERSCRKGGPGGLTTTIYANEWSDASMVAPNTFNHYRQRVYPHGYCLSRHGTGLSRNPSD
jgi:hypothetical protein